MNTITINLYSFNELSKEVQNKVIEKERDSKYENGDLLYFFKDYCIEQAKDKGFEDIILQYSLSYFQGDGLSFSAQKFTKLEELFNEVLGAGKQKTAKLLAENCTVIMKGNNGRYCYASKSDIDLYIENYTSSINVTSTNNINEVVGKVLEKLEDIYMDLCEELERTGYADIEYETSDEAIIETIEANDYTFEENGTLRNA